MVEPLGATPSPPRYPPKAPKKGLCEGLVCIPCNPLMMCIRSLNGSKASMGSGNFALAKDPLFFMPAGMAVAGSKPWFCMKKITRLGLVFERGAAWAKSGTNPPPRAAPKPAAIPCIIFLRSMYIIIIAKIDHFITFWRLFLDNIDKLILTKVEASIGAEVGL